MNNQTQHELFRKIQVMDFLLDDTALYLDTHPEDGAALNHYHKYQALSDQLVYQYTNEYGPLSQGTVVSQNRWTWIDSPWPWELEA